MQNAGDLTSAAYKRFDSDLKVIEQIYGVSREAVKGLLQKLHTSGQVHLHCTVEDQQFIEPIPVASILSPQGHYLLYRHNLIATFIFVCQALDNYLRNACSRLPHGKFAYEEPWFSPEVLSACVGFSVQTLVHWAKVQQAYSLRDQFLGVQLANPEVANVSHETLMDHFYNLRAFAKDFDLAFQMHHAGVRLP